MRCLDARLRSLTGLSQTLAAADDDVIDAAPEAAARLPAIDRCADADYVTAAVAPPDDPELDKAVESVRDRLARIDAMELAGQYEAGWAAVQQVQDEVERLDYPPLATETALRVGMLGLRTRHVPEAEAGFRQAFFDGRRVGDDETRTRAAVYLVRTLGLFAHDHDAGLAWADHARAEVDRFGDPRLRGDLLNHLGVIAHDQGKFDEAIALHREALAVRQEALGPEHPDCGHSLMELGLSLHAAGKWEEAVASVEESVKVLRGALGDSHPIVAHVYGNMAATLANSGKLTQASEYFERTADAWRRVQGPGSASAAMALTSGAMMAHKGGAHERESELFDRAMAAYDRVTDPEAAARRSWAQTNRAISRMDDGDVETGVSELEAVTKDLEARDSDDRAYAYTWLAIGYGRLGRHDDAVAPLQRAMTLHEAAGTEGPELGRTLFELARHSFVRGEADTGRQQVRRAVASLPPLNPDGHDRYKALRDKWGGWLAEHEAT